MPSDQPFNELGQILANGGEIALGLAISRGWSSQQIALLFSRRFEPITPQDRQRLTSLAERAVAAAAAINEMEADNAIDLEDIPVNPYLFGDDPSGRRGKVAGRFTLDEGEHWFDFRHDTADIGSVSQMMADVEAGILSDLAKYPEGGGGKFGGNVEHLTIKLELTERRF